MEGRVREGLEEEESSPEHPDISHASTAHPHHLDLVFSSATPAPFDRWRKGGLES